MSAPRATRQLRSGCNDDVGTPPFVEAEPDRLLVEHGLDPGSISREVDEHAAEHHGRTG